MTNPDLTHLVAVLDRSGSMSSIQAETVAGFAELIELQRHAPGECRVTLVRFDDEYDVVYRDLDVADVPPLELEPRGMTALRDAICRTILETGRTLAALPEEDRPGAVVVAIMTDGHENASREFGQAEVKRMIEHQERVYSWTFMYLGANQDAIEVGRGLGIAADRSITYAAPSAAAAMRAAGRSISGYRTRVAAGESAAAARAATAFSAADRSEALGESD